MGISVVAGDSPIYLPSIKTAEEIISALKAPNKLRYSVQQVQEAHESFNQEIDRYQDITRLSTNKLERLKEMKQLRLVARRWLLEGGHKTISEMSQERKSLGFVFQRVMEGPQVTV